VRTLARPPALLTALAVGVVVAGCSAGSTGTADDVVTGSATPSQAPISPRVSLAPAPTPTAAVTGFPIGTAVPVDYGYTVAVTAVSLDAEAAVTAVSPEATAPNGRMVLVDLTATPTPGVSTPSTGVLGLSVRLVAGEESYGMCDDAGELLAPVLAPPAPDGSLSWQVCLDVTPEAAVPTSAVEVSDPIALTVGGSAVTWSLG